jgi:hypothetical protein
MNKLIATNIKSNEFEEKGGNGGGTAAAAGEDGRLKSIKVFS